jgi:hypothetical protein
MKFFKSLVCFAGISISLINLSAQGYEIKIKIPALKDSSILLGHHFASATALYPDDTVKLDKNGAGVFKAKKPLPSGMYLIFLSSSKKYFDIFLSTNQKFSIESDTTDFMKTVKFNNSPENKLFYEYQNLLSSKREIVNQLFEIKKKSESSHQKDSLSKMIDNISGEVTSYTEKLIKENPDNSFGVFLKSLQDIKVPDPPRNAQGKITDSTFQYRYYKNHYFDNFNIADARLLRTPLYEQKVKNYVEKVIPLIPDSINKEVDMLLEKVRNNEEVFRYLLVTLFNQYASSQIMGMDAVFIHIAEKWYLPLATWSDKEFKDKLVKEISKKKPNLLGNKAPDLKLIEIPEEHFRVAKTDTALKSNPYVGTPISIYDIKAKYLIVIFWESDCGHCKKTVPLLYDTIYPAIKNNDVKILAIHMIASVEGKRKWIDFVNEHHLYGWINAWSPYSYEYKDLYDVYTTPVIYVLDENKKILAKRIGPEQIVDIINFEVKKNSK